MDKIPQAEQAPIISPNKRNPTQSKKRGRISLFYYIGCILLVAVCAGLGAVTVAKLTTGAYKTFSKTAEAVSEDVKGKFYDLAYEFAESTYHVSNQATITIDDVQEISKLEVLQVRDVTYITNSDEESAVLKNILDSLKDKIKGDYVCWLKVPGTAVFTVDMTLSEFIVDYERAYILIRIPNPDISEFTIDYKDVEVLWSEDEGLFDHSVSVGVETAQSMLQDAESKLWNEMLSNQRFYQSARNAAETILTNLVKEFNADVEDLTVVIEFIE